MAQVIISNAFSLQMLDTSVPSTVRVTPLTVQEASSLLGEDFLSTVGHADCARIVSGLLGVEVPQNRVSNKLTQGDVLIVAQIIGGRLPEGATSLPEGVDIKFMKVEVVES